MQNIRRIKLWFKLNIYSQLLCLISVLILFTVFAIPLLRQWWICTVAVLVSLQLLKKAEDIFEQYPQKVNVYYSLVRKAKKKFDQRYFVPYMKTACMRSVVFWSLIRTGNLAEYSSIKKRFKKESKIKPVTKFVVAAPKIMEVTMQHGKLHFVTRNNN
ncbi:MAG: hypothetical protein J6W00_03530 [Lentisphaeria bacterium]|nr:hypothetical protein [Lentisphaeria bacterium]